MDWWEMGAWEIIYATNKWEKKTMVSISQWLGGTISGGTPKFFVLENPANLMTLMTLVPHDISDTIVFLSSPVKPTDFSNLLFEYAHIYICIYIYMLCMYVYIYI